MIRKIAKLLLFVYILVTTYAVVSTVISVPYLPFLTPLSSLLAFSFAILHGSERLGWKNTLLLLGITFIISLLFESVGVSTGWVYGSYHYTDKLGYKVFGLVPLLIPIAWFMMSYPSFIIATRILPAAKSVWTWRLAVSAVGSLIMTAWDMAMDPMMVASGHWVWDQPGYYFGIPIQNYWGWWLTIFVAFLLFLAAARIEPSSIETTDRHFERFAIISYMTAGLSNVFVDFQVGLAGPGLAGLFAMLPWMVWGWVARNSSPQPANSG